VLQCELQYVDFAAVLQHVTECASVIDTVRAASYNQKKISKTSAAGSSLNPPQKKCLQHGKKTGWAPVCGLITMAISAVRSKCQKVSCIGLFS